MATCPRVYPSQSTRSSVDDNDMLFRSVLQPEIPTTIPAAVTSPFAAASHGPPDLATLLPSMHPSGGSDWSGDSTWYPLNMHTGPRGSGVGVENESQGIVHASLDDVTGTVVLHITLLASGFVIGPRGATIRDICKRTHTDIRSWTEHSTPRPVRVFVIAGAREHVAAALDIICQAVERYKALCEGGLAGRAVTRQQHVAGIDFVYQPPPRAAVPHAAALRGTYIPRPRVPVSQPPHPSMAQMLYGRTASAPLQPELRVATPVTVEPTRSLDLGLWSCQDKTHAAGLLNSTWPDTDALPEVAPLLQLAGSLSAALGGSRTGLGGLLALSPSDGSEAAAGAPGAGVAEQQLGQWLSDVLPDDVGGNKGCIASRSLSAPMAVPVPVGMLGRRPVQQDKTSWGI